MRQGTAFGPWSRRFESRQRHAAVDHGESLFVAAVATLNCRTVHSAVTSSRSQLTNWRQHSKGNVMKWQGWKGFVVGIFASLGFIGGGGLARAAAEPEPTFELPAETGKAVATVAPGPEASFDLPAEGEAGTAFATVGPGPEPTFDLPTEAREAHATVAPQSEPDFGGQRAQVQEKH